MTNFLYAHRHFNCFLVFLSELSKSIDAMWKFIRGKGQQPLAERQKLQKELFAYKKVSFSIWIHSIIILNGVEIM